MQVEKGPGRSSVCSEKALRRIYTCGEFFVHFGQPYLGAKRIRMRGAEDPTPPLDYVLHDGFGFEQVVACVEINRIDAAPC